VRLLPLLLLTSCWGSSCPGWDATPKAGFERMAAARLQSCVQNNPCVFLRQCFAESNAYCLDAGYAITCGQMEPEGTCGAALK
jgi:hypothetical protein